LAIHCRFRSLIERFDHGDPEQVDQQKNSTDDQRNLIPSALLIKPVHGMALVMVRLACWRSPTRLMFCGVARKPFSLRASLRASISLLELASSVSCISER